MPMHPRLTELVEYVDAQRAALLDAASALPPERWTERPAAGRWSVAEVLEHLHMVEHGCARVIAKRAAEARAADHPAETGTGSKLGALDWSDIRDRSTRREVPDRVAPTGTLSGEAARSAVDRSRAELHGAIEAADGLALESIRHTHARLGELDLYQWILFVGHHEARHGAQMAEIVSQLGAAPASRA
jgi:uncharacterized damage-inducible protein DinB